MSLPNFSSLAGLEVFEKFLVVGGWVGGVVEHVTTMSNSNVSCLELSWVLTIWVIQGKIPYRMYQRKHGSNTPVDL